MFEAVVLIGLIVAGGYLAAGVVVAISMHYRGLSTIDPRTADASPLLRIFLTPGMAIFWPMILVRRGRTPSGLDGEIPAAPSPGWQRGVVLASALISVAGLAAAILVRQPPEEPSGSGALSLPGPGAFLIRPGPGPVLGRLFPSMPARFQRARNIEKRPGLHMIIDDGATVAPTTIFWAPALDPSRPVPPDAVLVSTVFGPEDRWFPFTASDQWNTGYWIAYSHVRQDVEIHTRTDGDAS